MKKLFEKPGEAYHEWNSSLPGYVVPAPECGAPFADASSLRANLDRVIARREQLRSEMIALQEEMDWLVYAAYGLIPADSAAVGNAQPTPAFRLREDATAGQVGHPSEGGDPDPKIPSLEGPAPARRSLLGEGGKRGVGSLSREQRPFVLWAQTDGDFDKAVTLIPADWPEDRKTLWRTRLEAIRNNEHVRRIEAPVYKRRWDEQWKVGNRWHCGAVAYDAEFVEAFDWWLSEKAEYWLEKKANGAPVDLEKWTSAVGADTRVQAAWEVVQDAFGRLNRGAEFRRCFASVIKGQTVPDNIPWAVPWEKIKVPVPASAKRIRGKLNVPRERFRSTAESRFAWTGREQKMV
jgi:hypothetical protein